MSARSTLILGLVVTSVAATDLLNNAAVAAEPAAALAREILATTGVKGGLVVHLSCGDGKLTAALRANDAFLVHGLDANAANVEKARAHLRSLKLYGGVSVEQWAGRYLPYADNLVNLVVVSGDEGRVSKEELLRVLAPGGVACFGDARSEERGARWKKMTKPRPKEIDEWTHFLHGPDNNAVADDSVVGPPRHVQWVAGPRWARSHEHLASVSAVVSAGGRIFYVVDEGPISSIMAKPKWHLAARDAFSGVMLWKRPIPSWEPHLREFRSGPPHLARRLVALQDTVYVTLGYGEPLSALDAATGKTVKTYQGTGGTEEVVCTGDVLLLVGPRDGQVASVTAIDAASEARLWHTGPARVMPTSLATDGERVVFQTVTEVTCLDIKTGKQLWSAERAAATSRPGWAAPTLVVGKDVVLSADRKDLVALSKNDGRQLWTRRGYENFHAPIDVFLTGGMAWSWTGSISSIRGTGFPLAFDPTTGEIKKQFEADPIFRQVGMTHHRCYRNKATSRYIFAGRAGIESIELATGNVQLHNWVRGTCQYGILPCNGLMYAPPHACACFLTAKLNSFNALAAGRSKERGVRSEERLKRGPAFGGIPQSTFRNPQSEDWPTYRHDAARSGFTMASVPASLRCTWQTTLGGKLSTLVIANGKVFVASINTHTVHALDAKGGRPVWSYTTGGRVDSPPTVAQGLAVFGSADGWVYCLLALDGKLVWRYRVGPEDRRVVSYGQLESAWPVHGSVLVRDGSVYVAAGRSSYLDGGIRFCRLDLRTGKELAQTVLYDVDPKTGRQAGVQGFSMTGALPDVMSANGQSVYLRQMAFDRESLSHAGAAPHLFSPTGFLDDSWWHRTYWVHGAAVTAGWGGWWRTGNQVPAGRILVVDESCVYGFGRKVIRNYWPLRGENHWALHEPYHLFAIDRPSTAATDPAAARRDGKKSSSPAEFRWSKQIPFRVRAMTLAGKTLVAAGPTGDGTARLAAVSPSDGAPVVQYNLDAQPVFDGLAVAGGRIFIAMTDGQIACFGSDGGEGLARIDEDAAGEWKALPTKRPARPRRRPTAKIKPVPPTLKHPDFSHLVEIAVAKSDLGYRLRSVTRQEALALQQLKTPLRKATLKAKFRTAQGFGYPSFYENGFLAFGDGSDETKLVKCGLHIYQGSCAIIEGPYRGGKRTASMLGYGRGKVYEVEVDVDLAAGQVTMRTEGHTMKVKLSRPLGSITHVGYSLIHAVTDFSPVEIVGE